MNTNKVNTQNSKINYTELLSANGPASVSDLTSNKLNNVHDQMYSMALDKFKLTIDNVTSYKFVEIKPQTFYQASSVMVISKKKPYTRKIYSLSSYWGDYKFDDKENFNTIKIDNSISIENSEIINIDYIRGVVLMRNAVTDNTFEVSFNRIDSYTNISSEMDLTDTFTYLYRQK